MYATIGGHYSTLFLHKIKNAIYTMVNGNPLDLFPMMALVIHTVLFENKNWVVQFGKSYCTNSFQTLLFGFDQKIFVHNKISFEVKKKELGFTLKKN